MNQNNTVVTRFAPSPTGFLHVGGVRTALYAWLFARKHNGTFILRIEDTDKEREVAGSQDHIIESLTWLGITWDQGPIRQSQRLDSYRKWAQVLIERGLAYPDPYTEEEIEALRAQAEEQRRPFLYREHRKDTTVPWDGTTPLRFKVPEIKRYTWHDMVRGELTAGEEALDDFILIKGDGYPTYNFAHIVDDYEMGVTHIMRGEEFISSTPKFLSLYDALQFPRPQFATMPVILGPDGKKKLSKRDGAKDILEYRAEGYLPEAMRNFLAFLGWHPEGDKEVLSTQELIEEFTVTKLQKGGARFDEKKLTWFNHEHTKRLASETYASLSADFLRSKGVDIPSYFESIAPLLQQRAQTFAEAQEILASGEFSFMEKQIEPPSSALLLQGAKVEAAVAAKHLTAILPMLQKVEEFTPDAVKDAIFEYATKEGRAAVLWPLRVALSGKEKSPDPFTIASLIGKDRTLSRIEAAIELL